MFAFDSVVKPLPPVASFNYLNVPKNGYFTFITYGVSEYNNPAWQEGRPELMLTVQSQDTSWAKILPYIGANMIQEYDFSYGEIIHFGSKISPDSDMSSFFVFAPSILDADDYDNIHLPNRTINLVALYPIYKSEADVINYVGLEKFMHHPEYDMYDVNRPVIRKSFF